MCMSRMGDIDEMLSTQRYLEGGALEGVTQQLGQGPAN